MNVNCQKCNGGFFVDEIDQHFYERTKVPLPTFCPECRFQRRCSFINVRNFFSRTLSGGSSPRISMYSQDAQLTIVDDREWWSDKFDFLSYGVDYDFQKPFFLQFRSLMSRVPLPHLQRSFSTFENSDFCNAASNLKNCYLVTNADDSEDCMYGSNVEQCKDCIDIAFTNKSELCYECVNVKSSYECLYCTDCENSSNLIHCEDCIGCHNCFGCIGLRQKEFHFFNKPFSKEAYQKELNRLHFNAWRAAEEVKARVSDFHRIFPRKYMHERITQNVTGDYIYQSKDVHDSYIVELAERCRYSHFLRYMTSGCHDTYDYTMFGVGADKVYECAWCGLGIQNLKFCLWHYGASDLEYCIGCHYSHNLFGCIGLRHHEFCIFNKQYTKEEYNALIPKIKKQMMDTPYIDKNGCKYRYGEFFPSELSPFKYNQTIAQDFCPLTEKEAKKWNLGWYSDGAKAPLKAMSWNELPDDISEIEDNILSSPIECKDYSENPDLALQHNCTRFFKITAQELKFYRQRGIPIPRQCHNSRHYWRLKKINPFKRWSRKCAQCDKEIQTSYSPDSELKIFCGDCHMLANH